MIPFERQRRRLLLGGGIAACGLLAGCDLSLRHGLLNDCADDMPDDLRTHSLVTAAWSQLDASKVWDAHCHAFGNGDSGSGLWYNPRMDQLRHPLGYLQRELYINASCAVDAPGRADKSFVERLLMQCRGMAPGFRVMLFGFDWARDDNGAPVQEYSTFYVPDDYVAALAARYPQHMEWVASIHPYDPRALERLESAAERGARAIKWLPSAQNIDPADARCDPFYARLAALGIPLITHGGDERAVKGFGEQLGNPLRLRRPLDAGVKVVVAHCASLGNAHDESAGVSNFDLFAQLMDEERYRGNLFGDISAITQYNRMHVIAALLERRDWHARLLNGSDYPLPGVVPLVSLEALVEARLLDAGAVDPLARLRKYNVLLFDFVLKRSLRRDGQVFALSVFETAPFFTRTA